MCSVLSRETRTIRANSMFVMLMARKNLLERYGCIFEVTFRKNLTKFGKKYKNWHFLMVKTKEKFFSSPKSSFIDFKKCERLNTVEELGVN